MLSLNRRPGEPKSPLAPVSLAGMDILVLSPTPTYPLDHGNRKRIHAYCSDLKRRGARIHFVYYPMEWPFSHVPADAIAAMTGQWDAFYLAPTTRNLYEWAKGEDHGIDEWWDPGIGNMLAFLFARCAFDAFIINYPFLSKGFEFCTGRTFKILDTHDKFTGRRHLLEQNGITKEFFYTTADQEKIALDRPDLVWAIKEEEAEFFRTLTRKPVITLPHAEPNRPVCRQRLAEDEDYLVVGMLGARNNINRKNAEQFVSAILPVFRRQLAPIKVRLAGGMCDDLEHLAKRTGVELMGRLEDVADFYRAIDVALIPMAFSTGLKIKAIEAFSTGLPIIAHGHAVEGIPVDHPYHGCTSEADVAQACLDVAYDPCLLDELRTATLETATRLQAHFDQALDKTSALIRGRSTIVVAIGPAFFDRHSLYREHTFQLIDYLRYLGRIVLYVDAMPELPAAARYELLNGLGGHAKLVIGKGAIDGDQDRARSLGVFHRHASFLDLLAEPDITSVWLEALPEELRQGGRLPHRGQHFIRTDALELQAVSAEVIEAVLRGNPHVQTVCAQLFSRFASSSRHFPVPFFRWVPRPLDVAGGGTDAAVVVLASWRDLPAIRALAPLLADDGELVLILDDISQPDSANTAEATALGKAIYLSALVDDCRDLPISPAKVIRLSDSVHCQMLQELYLRMGTPVAGFAVNTCAESLADQVTTLIGEGGNSTTSDADASLAVLTGNDAGFAKIWKAYGASTL